MKKYIKDIILVLVISFIILLFTGVVDFTLSKNKKDPVFCKKTDMLWDGGSYTCSGLYYKVYVHKDITGKIINEEFKMFKKD